MNAVDHRSPRYVAVLAVAAGLILAAGWLLRPVDIPENPPPVPSETELQELARRAQRRSLDSRTAYFAELAAAVHPSLGYIPSTGTSGLVWDDSHVITGPIPVSDRRAPLTVRVASGERGGEATTSRRLPLSVLEISLGLPVRIPRRAAAVPQIGDWVIAVWQTDQAPAFAAGNFRQTTSTNCGMAVREFVTNIPLTRAMTGGGIFNMDRELLGVMLPCGDHMAAIEPSSVDDMLKRVATIEERLLAVYGVLVSAIAQGERQYFSDADGLLVREVWVGSSGEAASLQPGDIVVALNDHTVAEIDDLRPLTAESDQGSQLKVRRGSRIQTIMLQASAGGSVSSENGSDVGLVLESPTPRFRIDSVLPDSRAARAGVKAGDVLRRINHVEPRTRAQADRAVTSATSMSILLEVERDQRRLAIVIPGRTPR